MSLLLFLGLAAVRPAGAAEPPADPGRTWHVANRLSPIFRLLQRMPPAIEFSEMRLRTGDDPRWAQPHFDDHAWPVIARGDLPRVPKHAGILWLRFRIRQNSPEGRLPGGVLLFNLSASYEVYWDGTLLGQNGVPGDGPEAETVGWSQHHWTIPPSLTGAGEHVLALRLSTWHTPGPGRFTGLVPVMIAADAFEAMFRRDNILPVMSSGALFTITIAALVMWVIAARRRTLLLFAGMCFFGGAMEAASWYSMAYIYPYSWRFGLAGVITGAGLALSFCLAAVIAGEWDLPWKRRWLAGLLLVDAALVAARYPRLDWLPQNFIATAFVLILGFSVWAVRRRRHGVWVIALVISVSGVLLWQDPLHFIGLEFFFRFLPAVLGVLLLIALRLGTERRRAQEIKLTAARLEIELLKKNLQPHFLMNTLTALAQTIEEAPASAVRLIDDLAVEFRTLARMAGEKTVPLTEELELCRAHLRVMQARTDVGWRLDADGVDGAAPVPPALFLTLIENGFSHQRARKGDVVFTLRAAESARARRYTFRSPGVVTSETNRVTGGTGLRYVRARLEESFPDAWALTQGEVEGGWQTMIELREAAPGGAPA